MKAISFGMLSQMPWTDLPVGLSPGCSIGTDPLKGPQQQLSETFLTGLALITLYRKSVE